MISSRGESHPVVNVIPDVVNWTALRKSIVNSIKFLTISIRNLLF